MFPFFLLFGSHRERERARNNSSSKEASAIRKAYDEATRNSEMYQDEFERQFTQSNLKTIEEYVRCQVKALHRCFPLSYAAYKYDPTTAGSKHSLILEHINKDFEDCAVHSRMILDFVEKFKGHEIVIWEKNEMLPFMFEKYSKDAIILI